MKKYFISYWEPKKINPVYGFCANTIRDIEEIKTPEDTKRLENLLRESAKNHRITLISFIELKG